MSEISWYDIYQYVQFNLNSSTELAITFHAQNHVNYSHNTSARGRRSKLSNLMDYNFPMFSHQPLPPSLLSPTSDTHTHTRENVIDSTNHNRVFQSDNMPSLDAHQHPPVPFCWLWCCCWVANEVMHQRHVMDPPHPLVQRNGEGGGTVSDSEVQLTLRTTWGLGGGAMKRILFYGFRR